MTNFFRFFSFSGFHNGSERPYPRIFSYLCRVKPIAVIILNWNGDSLLRRFLPTVVQNTPGDLADVIVADNGSTDGSPDWVAETYPDVRLLRFEKNYGFAEGYNRAIALTDYPYTVLLNSDVDTPAGWLQPLYDFMDSHPNVGACQPKILSQKNPGVFEYAGAAGGLLDRNGFPYCRGRIFDTIEADNGQYDDTIECDWASGACLMVRTGAYVDAGGLDPRFFAHMEEIDLCWRIRRMGLKVMAVGSSRVYHVGGATLAQGNPRKTFLNFRNNLLMLRKNLPRNVRRVALIRRRLLDTVAMAGFLAKGHFADAYAVLRAHISYARMSKKPYADVPDCPNPLSSAPNIITQYYIKHHRHFPDLK